MLRPPQLNHYADFNNPAIIVWHRIPFLRLTLSHSPTAPPSSGKSWIRHCSTKKYFKDKSFNIYSFMYVSVVIEDVETGHFCSKLKQKSYFVTLRRQYKGVPITISTSSTMLTPITIQYIRFNPEIHKTIAIISQICLSICLSVYLPACLPAFNFCF